MKSWDQRIVLLPQDTGDNKFIKTRNILLPENNKGTIWATTWENVPSDLAPSEDSNQPMHPRSLIRVFGVRTKRSLPPCLSKICTGIFCSDCANSQAGLNLRWAPMSDPAGTWRKYNVASTSMQRHDVASTLRRRYIYVMCPLGSADAAHVVSSDSNSLTHCRLNELSHTIY